MSTRTAKQQPAQPARVALRYVGAGRALIGVPARDLSADEAAAHDVAALLASGLYEVAPEVAPEEEADGTRT